MVPDHLRGIMRAGYWENKVNQLKIASNICCICIQLYDISAFVSNYMTFAVFGSNYMTFLYLYPIMTFVYFHFSVHFPFEIS